MNRRILFSVLLCIGLPMSGHSASQPPGSDIWLSDIIPNGENIGLSDPRNLTRRPGYDNQPAFVTNHSLLFTSEYEGQTDAWRLDLDTGQANAMLRTPESEYSPTPAPRGEMSVVRVALNDVQQLWVLPPGESSYELIFPMLEGVGYHAWVDENRVALFMLQGEERPPELHIADRRTGEVAVLGKDIGRSLHPLPGRPGSLVFVEPGQDGKRWIKRLDFDARRIQPLAPVLDGSEDFALLPDGRLVMAQGRAIHVHDGRRWQQAGEFQSLPGSITRLAVSPDGDRLAFVVTEGE